MPTVNLIAVLLCAVARSCSAASGIRRCCSPRPGSAAPGSATRGEERQYGRDLRRRLRAQPDRRLRLRACSSATRCRSLERSARASRAGLCWVAASFGINYLFERRPLGLWLINGGYHTLQFTVFGLILGLASMIGHRSLACVPGGSAAGQSVAVQTFPGQLLANGFQRDGPRRALLRGDVRQCSCSRPARSKRGRKDRLCRGDHLQRRRARSRLHLLQLARRRWARQGWLDGKDARLHRKHARLARQAGAGDRFRMAG